MRRRVTGGARQPEGREGGSSRPRRRGPVNSLPQPRSRRPRTKVPPWPAARGAEGRGAARGSPASLRQYRQLEADADPAAAHGELPAPGISHPRPDGPPAAGLARRRPRLRGRGPFAAERRDDLGRRNDASAPALRGNRPRRGSLVLRADCCRLGHQFSAPGSPSRGTSLGQPQAALPAAP